MIKINGKIFPWQAGLTVRKLLEEKKYTFPLLVVTVNGKPVAQEDYSSTRIEDNDEIKVIHLIGGG